MGSTLRSGPCQGRRQSQEWKTLYGKRWTIEQLFKTQKQSRRLERHYIRGMDKIKLHAMMSILSLQATALLKVQSGSLEMMRWGVRKVA